MDSQSNEGNEKNSFPSECSEDKNHGHDSCHWIQRLNRAIRYVESNLTPQDVASKANMSSFHFQRTFSVVTGVTLAARELMEGAGILDTAVKYGYESQASFTRAYQNMHGFTPGGRSAAGRDSEALETYLLRVVSCHRVLPCGRTGVGAIFRSRRRRRKYAV